MDTIVSLGEQYLDLDRRLPAKDEDSLEPDCLLAFDYEYPEQPQEIAIDTDEFTALCPWTGLPDYGALTVTYVPDRRCIELKSLKYYLLSYRDVGIVQEHAAARIIKDLVELSRPRWMKVSLDYKVRGGIHTAVSVEHGHRDRALRG